MMWSRYKAYLVDRATGLSAFRLYAEICHQSAYWVVLLLIGCALGMLAPTRYRTASVFLGCLPGAIGWMSVHIFMMAAHLRDVRRRLEG